GFVEAKKLDVGDAGLDPEGIVHALALDFLTDDRKSQRLGRALARNHDLYRGAWPSLEQVGDFGGVQALGVLIVDADDDISGAGSHFVRGETGERNLDGGLAVRLRTHLHADAGVPALLILAHQLEFVRIEEVRVGIERTQHPRDGALIYGLVRAGLFGKILFDDAERLLECGDFSVFVVVDRRRSGGCYIEARPVDPSKNGARQYNRGQDKKRASPLGHASSFFEYSVPTFIDAARDGTVWRAARASHRGQGSSNKLGVRRQGPEE